MDADTVGHAEEARYEEEGVEVEGYAEAAATWLAVGANPEWDGTVSLRRAALGFEREFKDLPVPMAVEIEVEWENAMAGPGWPGTVEVEEAKVELDGGNKRASAGLLIVPFGVLNDDHHPNEYYGVSRPSMEQILIPTTWRELGLGGSVEGDLFKGELYAMTALDPTGLDDSGLGNARTHGAGATSLAGALSGRLLFTPAPMFHVGLSGYASDTGPAADWYDAGGQKLDLFLPVYGGELDLGLRRWGFDLRALAVAFFLPESDDLMEAYKADGSRYFPEGAGVVPTRMAGASVTLAWDVLSLGENTQKLSPWVRLEKYNTQWGVPEGLAPDPLRNVTETTLGLDYQPQGPVVLKADLQLRDRQYGDDELQLNAGLGFSL